MVLLGNSADANYPEVKEPRLQTDLRLILAALADP
jgi:hypothetical protein